ncbi:nucleotide binding protein [[Candida] boidinii]|nr:nucleotide binding protein [[Candida] boidinii]
MSKRSKQEQRVAYMKRAQDYTELMKKFTSHELTEIGNYKIIKEIGHGAFGQVYLAYHKFLKLKVVLKKGNRMISSGNDNLMREFYYLREFKEHPNIAKIYEIVFTESSVYMVLEYYPEGDLFDYLTKTKRLPLDEALNLFTQMCGIVNFIHLNGCCHRDLKLENILLDKKFNVKLSDLGFTRELPLKHSGNSNGLLNEFCGTIAYMAPELLQREPYSGIKIDIWSLGIILYTLVIGQMPFDDSLSDDELSDFILNTEPNYNHDIFIQHPDLVQLLEKLLSKSPEKRVNSLDEILSLPILSNYNGEKQLSIANKLMIAQDEYLGEREQTHFSDLSTSERNLVKDLKHIGVDKDLLKKSLSDGSMDSLAGFWNLLKEKNIKRYSKRKKLANRSRSVLRLTTSKSFIDARKSPLQKLNKDFVGSISSSVFSPIPLPLSSRRRSSNNTEDVQSLNKKTSNDISSPSSPKDTYKTFPVESTGTDRLVPTTANNADATSTRTSRSTSISLLLSSKHNSGYGAAVAPVLTNTSSFHNHTTSINSVNKTKQQQQQEQQDQPEQKSKMSTPNQQEMMVASSSPLNSFKYDYLDDPKDNYKGLNIIKRKSNDNMNDITNGTTSTVLDIDDPKYVNNNTRLSETERCHTNPNIDHPPIVQIITNPHEMERLNSNTTNFKYSDNSYRKSSNASAITASSINSKKKKFSFKNLLNKMKIGTNNNNSNGHYNNTTNNNNETNSSNNNSVTGNSFNHSGITSLSSELTASRSRKSSDINNTYSHKNNSSHSLFKNNKKSSIGANDYPEDNRHSQYNNANNRDRDSSTDSNKMKNGKDNEVRNNSKYKNNKKDSSDKKQQIQQKLLYGLRESELGKTKNGRDTVNNTNTTLNNNSNRVKQYIRTSSGGSANNKASNINSGNQHNSTSNHPYLNNHGSDKTDSDFDQSPLVSRKHSTNDAHLNRNLSHDSNGSSNLQLLHPISVSRGDDHQYEYPVISRNTSESRRGRSTRPGSVISTTSLQTTLSETSNGSGYNTGYSTDTGILVSNIMGNGSNINNNNNNNNIIGNGTALPPRASTPTFQTSGSSLMPLLPSTNTNSSNNTTNRPVYYRAKHSDISISSKMTSRDRDYDISNTSQGSPSSSVTNLSRSASIDSSVTNSSFRGRRKKKLSDAYSTSAPFKDSPPIIVKRGKSPITKINARWSYLSPVGRNKYRKVPKKLTKESKRSQSIIEEETDNGEGIGEEDEVSSIDTSHINIKNPNNHIHGQLLKSDGENSVNVKDNNDLSMKQLQSGHTDYFQLNNYDTDNPSTVIPTFNIITYKKGKTHGQNGGLNNNNGHLMDSVSENFLNEEGEEEEEEKGEEIYMGPDDLADTKRLLNSSPHDQGGGLNNLFNKLHIDGNEAAASGAASGAASRAATYNDQDKNIGSASTIINRSTLRGDDRSGNTEVTANGNLNEEESKRLFSSSVRDRNLPNEYSSVQDNRDPASSVPGNNHILNVDAISDVSNTSSNKNFRYINDDELSIEDAADDADLDDDDGDDDDYIDDDEDDYSEAIESLSDLRDGELYSGADDNIHLSHIKNATPID